jgi:hypothetical protein
VQFQQSSLPINAEDAAQMAKIIISATAAKRRGITQQRRFFLTA